MINTSCEILVIGAGVIGSSIFFHLADKGYKVAIAEQHRVAMGCTAWSGGIVRCFHPNADMSDKAVFGWRYFNNFESMTGVAVDFKKCGFMYFPEKDNCDSAKNEVSRLSSSIPIEWLEGKSLKDRYEAILQNTSEVVGAAFEPEAGFMDPLIVSRAWVQAARLRGGIVYEGVEVKKINFCDGGKISGVETSNGYIRCNQVIVAAGAYTPNLLKNIGISHDFYVQDIQVDLRVPTKSINDQPAFTDEVFDLNGRPDPQSGGIYIGHPTYVRPKKVSAFGSVSSSHSRKIVQEGKRRWVWVEDSDFSGGLRSSDCYTADGGGRVMFLNDSRSLYVATGFSGGGFKMSPWIGSEIVRMVAESKLPT